jgi:Phage capsid family
MEPDFSGWVTRSGVKCSDGRTIMSHAFKSNHDQQVPLVWQHQHNAPDNVLGYVILHSQEEGVRGDGYFNDTPSGRQAKALVFHKDINRLSIYANQLVQQGLNVVHGIIREVSLVLSGANPGAFIDNINLAHGDGITPIDDEAIIYFEDEISFGHSSDPAVADPPAPPSKPVLETVPSSASPEQVAHAADLAAALPDAKSPDLTVQDVIDSMNEAQRNVMFALIGEAMGQSDDTEGTTQGDGDSPEDDPGSSPDQPGTTLTQDDKKGEAAVTRNVFDQTPAATEGETPPGRTLTHSDLAAIFADARKQGSLKGAVEDYALSHGITNIDLLFPDARAVSDTPDWQSRRQEWVQGVLTDTRHTPFSRIKTMLADITLDEARARGYVKGAMKREEWYSVSRRTTTPQTVYKKQKLDRDDILDITDFDVVAWLKGEMRLMLDEEVARAILIGDGRDVADPDKISETNVRPVLTDSDVYTTTVNVDDAAIVTTAEAIVDAVATSMQYFQGTGQPKMYAPRSWITKMLLTKDTLGRRLHGSLTELADAMGVGSIVPVDVMEASKDSVIAIIVNLADYNTGTDRGGEVNFFDDFDIDYNKYTYLYETRLSGALVKFKSAIIVKQFTGAGGLLADPTVPTFVKATGVVTIPTMANVSYVSVNDSTGVESASLSAGAQSAISAGTQIHIRAKAAATYGFSNNAVCNWTFQRPAA